MKNLGLIVGTLLISTQCYAGLLDTQMKSVFSKSSTNQANQGNPSIVYGGQDISRRVVATADESSSWASEPHLIG